MKGEAIAGRALPARDTAGVMAAATGTVWCGPRPCRSRARAVLAAAHRTDAIVRVVAAVPGSLRSTVLGLGMRAVVPDVTVDELHQNGEHL